jgi:hypothetical protein
LVQDPWLLDAPSDLPSDTYRLELTVFDADTEAELTRLELGEVTFP